MKPKLHFALLFAGIAVYVGRGALLGKWAVPRGLRIVLVTTYFIAYALRGDHRPIIYE